MIEIIAVRDLTGNEMKADTLAKREVYIMIDKNGSIREASSYASNEEALDAQIRAASNGWIYLPLDITDIARELDRAGVRLAC